LMLKYPEGALSAWTGALQGWAEGDAIRGDREFVAWKAAVKKGRDAFADDLAGWHATREKYKDNWEQMKTEMAIKAAKAGASKEAIEALLRQPETEWKKQDDQMKRWEEMVKQSDSATLARIAQEGLNEQRRLQEWWRQWNATYKMANDRFNHDLR